MAPAPVLLPGESQGREPGSYSPRGRKESGTTETSKDFSLLRVYGLYNVSLAYQ